MTEVHSGLCTKGGFKSEETEEFFHCQHKYSKSLPLRRPKRLIFLGQGPVQGPREEMQGPCAKTTNLVNRNGCNGHLDMCKGHKKRCKGL